jgi:CelD/BcsL family acetyltransferase involved in cellulose biosynthesis
MRFSVLHPNDLDAPTERRWLDLLARSNGPKSGFVHPGFAKAVGAGRKDARICLAEDGADLVAVLAIQQTPSRSAMPLGSPITDHLCLIIAPGRDLPLKQMVKALKVDRLDLIHANGSEQRLAPFICETTESLILDLKLHREQLANNNGVAKFPLMRDLGRKRRKLEREKGPVSVEAFSQSTADMHQLLQWKTEQYSRNRIPPILQQIWVSGTLDQLLARPDPDLRLVMFNLRVGETLVAGLIGLQSNSILHAWFPAFDPAYSDHSVGSLIWLDMIDAATRTGLSEIDMGPGEYAYKRATANAKRRLSYGMVGRANPASLWRGGLWQAQSLLSGLPCAGIAGKLRNLPGRTRRWFDLRRGLA